ncbi:hypothetical protein GE107_12425, partial [Cohnella sp. CFH 77786]|uniref:condensation domain-containing protein n=1 Tax=Cohnella sp. CFH 77786 TaxID=2662265 RepID=UPI001ECE77BF
AFVQLESMPLTASGKADRKALPEPEEEMATGTEYAAPENGTEEKLAALWAELLQRERVGVHDNFFELGGHSLKAAALTAAAEREFSVRLPLKEVFQHPTVRGLASRMLSGKLQRAYPPIPPAAPKPHYPATPAQRQMLIHESRNPASLSYHMPAALILKGDLDSGKLRKALELLTERHEALRTSFGQKDGRIVQTVAGPVDAPFLMLDPDVFFGSGGKEDWQQAAFRWLRPFDTARAPLFRTGLVPLGERQHLFLFDIHHAVSDGLSNGLLVSDLTALYEGRPLPPVKAQLKDYGEWLARILSGPERDRELDYWLTRFADGVPSLDWPTDADRSVLTDPAARDEGRRYRFAAEGEMTDALRRLARDAGCTLSMALLAAYQAMLGFWCGTEDVVTGLPTAGRSHPDLDHTAGLLVQTLPIRNRPIRSLSFADWLAEVKTSMLQAFDHPWLPAEELAELLDERGLLRWDATRHPLFDTMFVMQNIDAMETGSGELQWEPLDWSFATAKADLVLEAEERDGKLALVFEFRSRLLPEGTVSLMADGLLKLLERAAADPRAALGELAKAALPEGLSPSPGHGPGDGEEGLLFGSGFFFPETEEIQAEEDNRWK